MFLKNNYSEDLELVFLFVKIDVFFVKVIVVGWGESRAVVS